MLRALLGRQWACQRVQQYAPALLSACQQQQQQPIVAAGSSVATPAPLLQPARQPAAIQRMLQQQLRAASSTPLRRNPAYSSLNDDDVEFFRSVLGPRGVVTDASALEPLNR